MEFKVPFVPIGTIKVPCTHFWVHLCNLSPSSLPIWKQAFLKLLNGEVKYIISSTYSMQSVLTFPDFFIYIFLRVAVLYCRNLVLLPISFCVSVPAHKAQSSADRDTLYTGNQYAFKLLQWPMVLYASRFSLYSQCLSHVQNSPIHVYITSNAKLEFSKCQFAATFSLFCTVQSSTETSS